LLNREKTAGPTLGLEGGGDWLRGAKERKKAGGWHREISTKKNRRKKSGSIYSTRQVRTTQHFRVKEVKWEGDGYRSGPDWGERSHPGKGEEKLTQSLPVRGPEGKELCGTKTPP